ncbi:MAG: hypothetical protein ACI849_000480 [Patiriisocius sp.]|jgi:hypothetical protein
MTKFNHLNWFVLATVIWCVFSFKFILIGYGGSGVRIDDLFILILYILFSIFGIISWKKIPYLVFPFILYLFISLLSSIYNGAIGRVDTTTALVYSLRSAEYFIFYYVGLYIVRNNINLYPIFKFYLLFLLVIVPLQMLNLLPVASNFSSTRAIGNTNGPYELAVLSAFLSFYFYYHKPQAKLNSFMSAVLLIATASRTTSFAFLIIILSSYRARLAFIAPVIAIVVFLAYGLFSGGGDATGGDGLTARFASLLTSELLMELQDANTRITAVLTSREYIDTYFIDVMADIQYLDSDASAYIRFYRWIALVKSSFANVDSILFGMGPSFSFVSVDGFYVRVLVETGIVGLGLYIWFIVRCLKYAAKYSLLFKYYIITMLVTAITIDIFFSYKPMMLFWLYLGWLHGGGKFNSMTLSMNTESK